MVMKAFKKDIWRTIKNEKKRFFSLMVIVVLGVTVSTGIKAGCDDLLYSADGFFDQQNLYDVSVQSTLGLTEEDVEALEALDGVEHAEGFYSETVYTKAEGLNKTAEVKMLSPTGLNEPYVLEGRLPQTSGEIAVTKEYLKETGKTIGDFLEFEEKSEKEEDDSEEQEQTFPNTVYTITASVIDPTDVNEKGGGTAMRSNLASDYIFFVVEEDVDSDIYSAVYVTLEGGKELLCYSDEYDDSVNRLKDEIGDEIKAIREQARTEEVLGEANEEIADAEKTMNEEFAKADQEIADAQKELEDGRKELEDGEKELEKQSKEADEEFEKAWKQIEDSKNQLESGQVTLNESKAKLQSGQKDLEAGLAELEANKKTLEQSQLALTEGKKQLEAGKTELTQKEEETFAQLDAGKQQIQGGKDTALATIAQIENEQLAPLKSQFGEFWLEQEWTEYRNAVCQAQLDASQEGWKQEKQNVFLQKIQEITEQFMPGMDLSQSLVQLAEGLGQADATVVMLDSQLAELETQEQTAKASFAAAWEEINAQEAALTQGEQELQAGWTQWNAGKQKLEAAQTELKSGWAQLEAGQKEINDGWAEWKAGREELVMQEADAREKIKEARLEIANGKIELADGEKELEENLAEYLEERAEAEQELEDAKKELEELEAAKWYIQNRYNLSGYNNIYTDSGAIASIGTMFPLLFLVIAILISLTTMNRMVDEQRGLIGTYQALGFTNGEIRRKYLVYALFACIAGGILGNICGYIILPEIIFIFFRIMYQIPDYVLKYNYLYGFGIPIIFVAAILGAVWTTCNAKLRHMPAKLMRPKAPKPGSRVLLERIGWIWNRLSFLNKVTARNLFRYKKRLFMTIIGISGCTGLLVCGFAIKDSVTDLAPRQYEETYHYDMMAVVEEDDMDILLEHVENREEIQEYLSLKIDTITLKNEDGETEDAQLYVVPEGADLSDYIYLEDIDCKEEIAPDDSGILVTRNAGTMLGFGAGDEILIQDLHLNQYELHVTAVVENYMGNFAFITQDLYEEIFGTYEANAILALLDEEIDQVAFVDGMGKNEWMLSATSVEKMKDEFSTVFSLINLVVYIILILAAGLAFVVLFTLSTTNISERDRELATIKVLGFYDPEVHSYVNKETLILTGIGILLGLPIGTVMGHALTSVLEMPSVYFAVSIHGISYGISAALTLGFALIISILTNRILNNIDPVEALKSIE